MTTPAFSPLDTSSLVAVRFYTPFDPYFYSVDNRPLQDLDANVKTLGTGGVDSARRAVAFAQIASAKALAPVLGTLPSTGIVSGLEVGFIAPAVGQSPTLVVNPGSLFVKDVVNASISSSIIRQGFSMNRVTFNTPVPIAGFSTPYLVQIKYVSLDSSTTIAASDLPFLDATNDSLPCLLMSGELKVSIKAGTSAGNPIIPAADAGWTPLYEIIISDNFAVTTSAPGLSIRMSAFGPSALGAKHTVPLAPVGAVTTTSQIANALVPTLPDSGSAALIGSVPMARCNPYLPLKISARTFVENGSAVFNFKGLIDKRGVSSGDVSYALVSQTVPSSTTWGVQSVSGAELGMPPLMLELDSLTGTHFAKTDLEALNMHITRNGPSASDTCTGVATVTGVTVFQ